MSRIFAGGFTALAGGLAALLLALAMTTSSIAADTIVSKDAPDLTAIRAKIKARDFSGAITDLNKMAETVQHADIYNLLGFSLRKSKDYKSAYTFYQKALEYDPAHKGAHEYLGELYVETGDMAKAKDMLAKLKVLCPKGCEEREDLAKAIREASAKPQTQPKSATKVK
jgi:Flp pilus assembly protein TadD